MPRQVIFIQGGSAGAYEADGELVAYLRGQLGSEYEVAYQPIAALEDLKPYAEVKDELAGQLTILRDGALVVGHSLGAWALMKFFSEEKLDASIAALFLAATPYIGRDGAWGDEVSGLDSGFAEGLPENTPLFLYHCRDDEEIPFEHLQRYADKIPSATVRVVEAGGHQFTRGLPELVADLKSL